MKAIQRAAVAIVAMGVVVGAADPRAAAQANVEAFAETDPVPNSGDAADDAAIWVHPDRPESSFIIGTDKQGGLAVYELDGSERAYLPDGDMNNVDVRYGFTLGGESVDLVVAGNRTGNRIAVYRVDVEARALVDVAAGNLEAGIEVYGSCIYQSSTSGETYAFMNSKDGEVVQYRLIDRDGSVDIDEVRRFDAGGQVEGCTADDELGWLYVGEEAVGIWRYGAEPDDGDVRTAVDNTGSGGHLTADVEGLTIYYMDSGAGYLIASSQGNNSYVVYERGGDNAYVTTFRLVDGEVDGTSDTDGIEVTSAFLGPDLPSGLFIAQDGSNSGGNQNYKLVRWTDIAEATTPMLALATGWDPRGGGGVLPERDGGVGPEDEDGGVGPGDSDGGGDRDAGRGMSSRDAGTVLPATMASGGCAVGGSHPSTALLPVLALVWLARRRRAS